jgi:hypothetical protein
MAGVFEMLDREWARLRRSRSAAAELADVCRVAGGARTLGEVEDYVRRADHAATDRVLLALVASAVDDGALAARVLLQLLLPGTRSLARRWWALGDPEERAAAAVMAVYHRIRRYPLARRPGRVAANIIMDAARELRLAVQAAPPATLGATPADRAAAASDPMPNPADELAQILLDAVADRVIDPADAALIAHSRIGGHRVEDLATHQGYRPRTLWDRRQRAERALTVAYAPAAAAAS